MPATAPSQNALRRDHQVLHGLFAWALERRKLPPDNPFNWTPIIISPHDHTTLYEGGNVLLESTDAGKNWQPISPDLTRHDPAGTRARALYGALGAVSTAVFAAAESFYYAPLA